MKIYSHTSIPPTWTNRLVTLKCLPSWLFVVVSMSTDRVSHVLLIHFKLLKVCKQQSWYISFFFASTEIWWVLTTIAAGVDHQAFEIPWPIYYKGFDMETGHIYMHTSSYIRQSFNPIPMNTYVIWHLWPQAFVDKTTMIIVSLIYWLKEYWISDIYSLIWKACLS